MHLDHFIELNFTGFEHVIDDIGGVSICVPFAINDPLSKLRLSAEYVETATLASDLRVIARTLKAVFLA